MIKYLIIALAALALAGCASPTVSGGYGGGSGGSSGQTQLGFSW